MKNQYRTVKQRFILASKGFVMGIADVIPGVSGGTIAFISGIYGHLLQAISSAKIKHAYDAAILLFFFWHPQKRKASLASISEIEWNFILTLFSGIILAVLTMAKIIPALMRDYPLYSYSLFFGLIVFSVWFPFKNMKRDAINFSILIAFAIGAFLLMGPSENAVGSKDAFYLFMSGAIAICAMILPGISGSYLLVLLGQYVLVLDALHARDFAIIVPFVLGIFFGITAFARVLKYLLAHFQSFTMAALTGLMIGSLRKIWPGFHVPESGWDQSLIISVVALIIAGGAVIFGLEAASRLAKDPDSPGSN